MMPKKRDMEAKGVKAPKVTERSNMLSTKEKAVARGGKFDLEATIVFVKKGPNPRKAGSQQWTRWEILMGHDGKTVKEYLSKGGDSHGIQQGLALQAIELRGAK
jgi:hypothetical protein